jgi:hypothetical protein
MSNAWNGWYHVNGNTYGSWLRGDERGWRARHHREHVEGDYRSPPPPGKYAQLKSHSRRLMAKASRRPVVLTREMRDIACSVMVESLLAHGVELIAISLDDHHYHLLARFTNARPFSHVQGGAKPTDRGPWASRPTYLRDPPRHYVGIAKMRATHTLRKLKLAPAGGLWGKRCKVTPIRDRDHQVNTTFYITDHALRGASLWTFKAPARS